LGQNVLGFVLQPSQTVLPDDASDQTIINYLMANTGSSWHFGGTCRLGDENDPLAVVNRNDLSVIGIQNLVVADLSIIPTIPTCHTNSLAAMIGYHAASLL